MHRVMSIDRCGELAPSIGVWWAVGYGVDATDATDATRGWCRAAASTTDKRQTLK
jgi:hypothetical protein